MEVFQEFTVEAAHHLTNVTPGHPCGGMHGHAYRIEVHDVQGLQTPTSENLALWIWDRLQPTLTGLCQVVVREPSASGCVYRVKPC